MPPKGPSGREKFKSKIEKGVERALPAERVKDLEEKVKEKTEERNKLKKTVSESIKKGFTNKETQDLAITAAEKQQIYKNVLASLANKLGGANEAKDLLKSFNIKSARDLMQKIGLSRIQEQRTYEHYSYAAKKGPGICFRDYDKIVEQPWGKKVIEQAFNNKHEYVFAFANKLNKNPEYAKDLLQRATAKSPKLAFHYVEKFKNMDGAQDILENAITRMDKTDLVFEAFNRYADAPWAINVLKFATEKNRDDAFLHLSRYKKSPEASQVLLKAIDKMENTAEFFRKVDEELKSVQGIANVLAIAAMKSPDAAIVNFDKYSDINNASSVIRGAIISMADTSMIFYSVEKFTGIKGGSDILMQAALKGPDADAVLDAYYEFKDLPNAVPILMIAISKSPETAFKRSDILNELPRKEAANLLNAAIYSKPDLAFDNIDTILKYDEFGKLFVNLATSNPMLIYKNISKLEGKIPQSTGNEILKVAFQSLKPADYVSVENFNVIRKYITKEQYAILKKKFTQYREFADKFIAQNLETAASGYYARSRSFDEMRADLLRDESLKNVLKVKKEWIEIPLNSYLKPVQARAMVARNLYTDNIPVTKRNVQIELDRIITERNKLKNTHIFKGRNVLHVAQNDEYHGKDVFGKKGSVEGIKKQSGSMKELRCGASKEQVKAFKKDLKDKIANTKPPLTFYYSGHGSGDSVNLISRGDLKLKLTPADLALALKQRHENFKNDPVEKENPPIIIISACYTANFARKMYQKIQNASSKPITMGGSEFGQVSYGATLEHKYDSKFDEHVLGLGSSKPSTFGTVIKNEKKDLSNTYVHLPTKRQVI
jgi:hypothetical protein